MRRIFMMSLLAGLLLTTACSQIMGNLRRDLDDAEPYSGPTTGGSWSERGELGDDMDPNNPYAVGHAERAPASEIHSGAAGRRSWVGDEDRDANARDRYRDFSGGESGKELAYGSAPSVPPPVKRLYRNGSRATRADFADDGINEGSLWASDGQTNYYFTKNKIRGVGDLVIVNIEDNLLKDTFREVTRTLSPKEREAELVLAQTRLRNKAMGIDDDPKKSKDRIPASAAAPNRSANGQGEPAAAAALKVDEPDNVPKATLADIDVSKSLDVKGGDVVMSEILERYPNGNYKIRGTKRLNYKGATRLMTVTGIVRGTDIGEDDTVASGKLYEYRLDVIR